MDLWLILTLSSISVLAIAEIAQKVAVTRTDDISAEANNTVVWFAQGLLSLIYYLVFVGGSFSAFDIATLIKIALVGCIYFWAGTLYYTSYKTGSVSINAILLSSSIIVTTILGIIFFGESTSLGKIIGSLIVISAIIFLNYEKKFVWKPGNNYALAGAALYGVAFTLDKAMSLSITPHLYQIFFGFSIGITGLLFRSKIIFSDLKKIHKHTLIAGLVAACAFFIWNKLNFVAYTVGGEVGRIDSINNSVVFLIIILEFLILKDRSNLSRKIAASIFAFIGVTLLTLSK